MRIGFLKAFQSHHLDIVTDALDALGSRKSGETEPDVPFDGKPREDTALLEDEDATRIGSAHRFAVNANFASSGLEKTRDRTKEGGFAAARRAQQADEFTVAELEIDIFEHGHTLPIPAENHADILGPQLGLEARGGRFSFDDRIRRH